jgi:hypothetical protein
MGSDANAKLGSNAVQRAVFFSVEVAKTGADSEVIVINNEGYNSAASPGHLTDCIQRSEQDFQCRRKEMGLALINKDKCSAERPLDHWSGLECWHQTELWLRQ